MDCVKTVAYLYDDMSVESTTTVMIVCKYATTVTTFYGRAELENDICSLIIHTLTQIRRDYYTSDNGFSNIQGMAQGEREHETQL